MSGLLLAANIVLLVAGQLFWKKALEIVGGISLHSLPSLLMSPLFLLGGICYGAATLSWLYALSRLPLSLAYPLQSLAYVVAMLAAWQLFGEVVPLSRWIGAGIILVGALVVGLK